MRWAETAQEIDPTSGMQDLVDNADDSGLGSMMQEMAFAIPGIDEAMVRRRSRIVLNRTVVLRAHEVRCPGAAPLT